jgi:6-phosphogluconolactonase (cycloisomerase 2 family)
LADGVDLGIPDFKILLDEEKVEKGARGVHTIYSFSLDGIEQTLNQTVLMANDRSTIYILMARCATTCYTKNKKSIEEIVTSYTVQGAK